MMFSFSSGLLPDAISFWSSSFVALLLKPSLVMGLLPDVPSGRCCLVVLSVFANSVEQRHRFCVTVAL